MKGKNSRIKITHCSISDDHNTSTFTYKNFYHREQDTRPRTSGIIDQIALRTKDELIWLMLCTSLTHVQCLGSWIESLSIVLVQEIGDCFVSISKWLNSVSKEQTVIATSVKKIQPWSRGWGDSNSQLLARQASTLTVELQPQVYFQETKKVSSDCYGVTRLENRTCKPLFPQCS